jgi:hypothetical protein
MSSAQADAGGPFGTLEANPATGAPAATILQDTSAVRSKGEAANLEVPSTLCRIGGSAVSAAERDEMTVRVEVVVLAVKRKGIIAWHA